MRNFKFILPIIFFILIITFPNDVFAKPTIKGMVRNAITSAYYPIYGETVPNLIWCYNEGNGAEECNGGDCFCGDSIPNEWRQSFLNPPITDPGSWCCRTLKNIDNSQYGRNAGFDFPNQKYVFAPWLNNGFGFGCMEKNHFITGVPDEDFPGTFSTVQFNIPSNGVAEINVDDVVYTPALIDIGGKALDSSSLKGIPGITINAPCGIGKSVITDANGNYIFASVAQNLTFCLRGPDNAPIGYQIPPKTTNGDTSYENQQAVKTKLDYDLLFTRVNPPQDSSNLKAECPNPGTIAYLSWTCPENSTSKLSYQQLKSSNPTIVENIPYQSPEINYIVKNMTPDSAYSWSVTCCQSGLCSKDIRGPDFNCLETVVKTYLKTTGGDVHANN